MTIQELIDILTAVLEENGDLDVYCFNEIGDYDSAEIVRVDRPEGKTVKCLVVPAE